MRIKIKIVNAKEDVFYKMPNSLVAINMDHSYTKYHKINHFIF